MININCPLFKAEINIDNVSINCSLLKVETDIGQDLL